MHKNVIILSLSLSLGLSFFGNVWAMDVSDDKDLKEQCLNEVLQDYAKREASWKCDCARQFISKSTDFFSPADKSLPAEQRVAVVADRLVIDPATLWDAAEKEYNKIKKPASLPVSKAPSWFSGK